MALTTVVVVVLLKKLGKKNPPKTLVDPNEKVSLTLIEREVSALNQSLYTKNSSCTTYTQKVFISINFCYFR